MGGLSAGFQSWTSANLVNPAANYMTNPSGKYSTYVLFDLGTEISFTNLRSNTSPAKHSTGNPVFSYMHFAFPVTSQKMASKNKFWAFNLGLKPINNISYKIAESKRIDGVDSVTTYFEGDGGIHQAYIGSAFRIKNLSLGVNVGYNFGSKDIASRRGFVNDSVSYVVSKHQKKTSMNGWSYNLGLQYDIPVSGGVLRLGGYTNLEHKLKATKDEIVFTYVMDYAGEEIPVDTVTMSLDQKGDIIYPNKWGVGFTYTDKGENLLFGIDYEQSSWKDYREYGEAGPFNNSYTVRAGAQYYPAKKDKNITKYFQAVKYRLGFYYGESQLVIDGKNRSDYAVTLGFGMPLHSLKFMTDRGNYALLNTAFEFGGRGNKNVGPVRENFTRVNVGISFTGNWFQKRKYY
jgi:hypothetical protein